MFGSFELLIATHYLKMRGAQSFLALTSLIGISIGTAILIIVISVMNGISDEIQDILMNVNGHIKIESYDHHMSDSEVINEVVRKNNYVEYSMPYIDAQALINSEKTYPRGALVRGVDIQDMLDNFPKFSKMVTISDQYNKENGLIMGYGLASLLGVNIGDIVEVISPVMVKTPSGSFPTIRAMQVIGLFETNIREIDENYTYISLDTARFLFKEDNNFIDGIEVFLYDNHLINTVQSQLLKEFDQLIISNWYERHHSFCRAILLERQLMKIVLFMIILISIFNVFSCMIILIREKIKDIAILRAFGASSYSIFAIFMLCGVIIYLLGFFSGLVIGLLVTLNLNLILDFINKIFGVRIMDLYLYDLQNIPVTIKVSDITTLAIYSLLLIIGFLMIPTYKSTLIEPAKVLRYS